MPRRRGAPVWGHPFRRGENKGGVLPPGPQKNPGGILRWGKILWGGKTPRACIKNTSSVWWGREILYGGVFSQNFMFIRGRELSLGETFSIK